MLNVVLKAAALAVVPKIIHEAYPPTKKAVCSAYDSVANFLCFSGDSADKGKTKSKVYQPRNKLTEAQYQTILNRWAGNEALPRKVKETQEEFTKTLNKELGLNYSRSAYCHFVFKRIIPKVVHDAK